MREGKMSELQPVIYVVFYERGREGDYWHTVIPCVGIDGVREEAKKNDNTPVVLLDGGGKSVVIDHDMGGLEEALRLWTQP
jgi:hypothetical protein